MLENFCLRGDEEPPREKLKRTWVKNGWEYATDTIVCVRRRSDLEDTPSPDGFPYPDAAAVFYSALGVDTDRHEIVVPMLENSEQCQQCLGTGHEAVPCEMCRGDGWHHCECGTTHQCGQCYGIGISQSNHGPECQDCDGTGEIWYHEDTRIGGFLFPCDRLVRLQGAGATHICVPEYGASDRCYGYGIFDDADGDEIEFVLCSKIERVIDKEKHA